MCGLPLCSLGRALKREGETAKITHPCTSYTYHRMMALWLIKEFPGKPELSTSCNVKRKLFGNTIKCVTESIYRQGNSTIVGYRAHWRNPCDGTGVANSQTTSLLDHKGMYRRRSEGGSLKEAKRAISCRAKSPHPLETIYFKELTIFMHNQLARLWSYQLRKH